MIKDIVLSNFILKQLHKRDFQVRYLNANYEILSIMWCLCLVSITWLSWFGLRAKQACSKSFDIVLTREFVYTL